MTAQHESLQPADDAETHVYSILSALDNQREANKQVNMAIVNAIPYLAGIDPDTISDHEFRADLIRAKQTFQGHGGK